MNKMKLAMMLGMASVACGARGAGFALLEQNASGLGNAYAGQAAAAEDASTVYFNPAGLSQIEGRQVILAGYLIAPSAKFADSGSTLAALGNGGDAGKPVVVANAYYAADLSPSLKLGVGLNSPFGLATEYHAPWAGQTQAIKSDLSTLNLNPALAWRVNKRLSLGAGLDWQHISAKLTQSVTAPGVTTATMKGDDDSWGWNLGALWQANPDTRLGLAYRSRVEHQLTGTMSVLPGVGVSADIALPDSASLSVLRHINPRWDLLADATWTGWSSFDKLEIRRQDTGAVVSLVPENWRDSWRVSMGLTYRPVREWTWRMGLAHDATPVPDASLRTVRIPDADRTWLAMGGQYRMGLQEAVDFGYAHLFVNDASIDHSEGGIKVAGNYSNQVDILSVQYTRGF